jgi:hypothetical protein
MSENLKKIKTTIETLKGFDKVLFLTCSNRYKDILETQTPKSTILAEVISQKLDNVTIINVPDLNIYPCEGNVSREDGNKCGLKEALLKDEEKNPSGYHRCWASIHNPDDELWKISKELFESDCVVFFVSTRWGNANMFYQKLIERLNWINNRFVPGNEYNIIKDGLLFSFLIFYLFSLILKKTPYSKPDFRPDPGRPRTLTPKINIKKLKRDRERESVATHEQEAKPYFQMQTAVSRN